MSIEINCDECGRNTNDFICCEKCVEDKKNEAVELYKENNLKEE